MMQESISIFTLAWNLNSESLKLSVLDCLAITTFFGANDVEEVEKSMSIMWAIFSPKPLSDDIRRGLNSVNRIIKDRNIRGVFGPILELFDCDEKFYTAVEVTAGNSQFHVVVETDEISTKIIRILSSEKGGRATFLPLNQVKAPHIDYPHNPDVEPLLKKLNFRSEYVSAFKQVFGRTVICHNLDVATNVTRSNGLDCITLKGDQVSKKGGMIGGFYDNKRSKLKFVSIIKLS